VCVCVRACACANHSAVSLFLALISGLKSQGCGTKEGKNAAGSAGSGKRRRHSAASAAGGERSAEEWGGNGLEEAARGLLRQSIDRQRGALAKGGSGGGAQSAGGWECDMIGVLRSEMVALLEAAKARL